MPPPRRSRVIFMGALGLVLLLAVFDYLTGPAISFFAFYLIPVSLAAWSMGRIAGVVVSLLCAGSWIVANAQGLPTLGHPGVLYWNALVRLGTFVFVAVLVSRRPPRPKTEGQLLLEDFRRRKLGLPLPTDIPLRVSDSLDWLIPALLLLNIIVLLSVLAYFGYLKH